MNANEPGLFDLPDREPTALPEQRGLRGRSREVWARTITAEVSVVDVEALRQAEVRANAGVVTIELLTDPHAGTEAIDLDARAAKDPFDALAWLVWPVEGLEGPVESGAFRILSTDSNAVPETGDRGILTWTVTVKLIDVRELRRLAADAEPEEKELIADSLAVAWQHAADPMAPLRSIPGITWRSVHVEVHHLPRRVNRER